METGVAELQYLHHLAERKLIFFWRKKHNTTNTELKPKMKGWIWMMLS